MGTRKNARARRRHAPIYFPAPATQALKIVKRRIVVRELVTTLLPRSILVRFYIFS